MPNDEHIQQNLQLEELRNQREKLISNYEEASKEYWIALNKHKLFFATMDTMAIIRSMFPGELKTQKDENKDQLDAAKQRKNELETQIENLNNEIRKHTNQELGNEEEVTRTRRVKPTSRGISYGVRAHQERSLGNIVEANMFEHLHQLLEGTTEEYTEQVFVNPSKDRVLKYEEENGIDQINHIKISQQTLSNLIEAREIEVGAHFEKTQLVRSVQSTLERVNSLSEDYEEEAPEREILERARQRLEDINHTIENRVFPMKEHLDPRTTLAVFAIAIIASLATYSFFNNDIQASLGAIEQVDDLLEIENIKNLIFNAKIMHTMLQAGILGFSAISLTIAQNKKVAASIINEVQAAVKRIENKENE